MRTNIDGNQNGKRKTRPVITLGARIPEKENGMNIGNLYDYMEREKDLAAFERYDLWKVAYAARRKQKYETESKNIASACKKCGFRVTRNGKTWKIS